MDKDHPVLIKARATLHKLGDTISRRVMRFTHFHRRLLRDSCLGKVLACLAQRVRLGGLESYPT